MTKIIESRNDFGTMNEETVSYHNLTENDKKFLCKKYNVSIENLKLYDINKHRKEILEVHRNDFGTTMGFDSKKLFTSKQNDQIGSYFEITKEFVEAHPNGYSELKEDVLVVTKNTPGVVVGHITADYPVVMMTDRKQGISVVGHCTAELIDKKLPAMLTYILRSDYNAKPEDIYAYVSAAAGENFEFDEFPEWAEDMRIWERCITYNNNGKYYVNLRPALLFQIIAMGVKPYNIKFNMDDTRKNPHYYSKSIGNTEKANKREKYGRNFAGIFYEDNENSKKLLIKKGRI